MVRFIESNAVNMFPLLNKLFDVDVCLRVTQNSQIVATATTTKMLAKESVHVFNRQKTDLSSKMFCNNSHNLWTIKNMNEPQLCRYGIPYTFEIQNWALSIEIMII